MKEEYTNRNDVFEPKIGELLRRLNQADEFFVPENYFEHMPAEVLLRARMSTHNEQDLKAPDSYFEDASEKMMDAIQEVSVVEDEPATETFFEDQRRRIVDQIHHQQKVRRIHIRRWSVLAAAASFVGLTLFIWPTTAPEKSAFASLLETTTLDEDDLDYFASDEDYYDLYLSEIEDSFSDTIIDDASGLMPTEDSLASLPGLLDPVTGLPLDKKANPVKPSAYDLAPTLEDLSEEEILKYLLEENEDDLLNELN